MRNEQYLTWLLVVVDQNTVIDKCYLSLVMNRVDLSLKIVLV